MNDASNERKDAGREWRDTWEVFGVAQRGHERNKDRESTCSTECEEINLSF